MAEDASRLGASIDAALAGLEGEDARTRFHLDPTEVRATFEQAREILFPEYNGKSALPLRAMLEEWAARLIRLAATEHHRICAEATKKATDCAVCLPWAEGVAKQLVEGLPKLRQTLRIDLNAAIASDPAAQGPLAFTRSSAIGSPTSSGNTGLG
jgi:hypothetical protein